MANIRIAVSQVARTSRNPLRRALGYTTRWIPPQKRARTPDRRALSTSSSRTLGSRSSPAIVATVSSTRHRTLLPDAERVSDPSPATGRALRAARPPMQTRLNRDPY